MVDVAQLVELRIVTPAVEGSNPFVHPTFLVFSAFSAKLPIAHGAAGLAIDVREWRNW